MKTFVGSSELYQVRQGRIKRDHLDNTYKSHGYMCQPISTAGLHGWEVVLQQDVKVIWDGISDSNPEHVKIIEGQTDKHGRMIADVNTANATIAWQFNAAFETDKDHNLLLMGAPNFILDGFYPMTAVLQTDWFNFQGIQYCWKITKANEELLIPAGTVIAFIMNYPKTLLEETTFEIRDMTYEEHEQMNKYNENIMEFYKTHEPWDWHQFYKHGIDPDGNKLLERPYKPNPTKPVTGCPVMHDKEG